MEDLKNHFLSILGNSSKSEEIMYAFPFKEIHCLDTEITLDEVEKVLVKAKENKAPGNDRIPIEYFKNAPKEFLMRMLEIFNNIFIDGTMPESFRKSIIFPIFKKGDMNDVNNYRGISFIDAIAKIYTYVLLDRLENWMNMNKVLHENQAGFRKGYSTVDHLFTLKNIIALKREKREKVYAFFVDFKTAFDGIPRKKLVYKLFNAGLSTKFMLNIIKMYTDTASAVWDGERLSDWFNTTSGVKQGCGFSPAFFAIFINDLVDYIKGGITIDELVINILMYADDIVIVANTPEELQDMIN